MVTVTGRGQHPRIRTLFITAFCGAHPFPSSDPNTQEEVKDPDPKKKEKKTSYLSLKQRSFSKIMSDCYNYIYYIIPANNIQGDSKSKDSLHFQEKVFIFWALKLTAKAPENGWLEILVSFSDGLFSVANC